MTQKHQLEMKTQRADMRKLNKTVKLASKLVKLSNIPGETRSDDTKDLATIIKGMQKEKKAKAKPDSMARNAVEKFMQLKLKRDLT